MDVRANASFDRAAIIEMDGVHVIVPARMDVTVEDLPWKVTFVAEATDGPPVITSVTLERKPDGPDVGAAQIRGIRLGEALRAAIDQVSHVVLVNGNRVSFGTDTFGIPKPDGISRAVMKRGRRQVESAELAAAANGYNEAVRSGRTDRLVAVMEALEAAGYPCSIATAHRRVDRARRAGLIIEEDS